jgi:cytidylate kinase
MNARLNLPSSVEERISGWVRIQEGYLSGLPARARLRPTITLSRQYGCEGVPLALALQKRMEQAGGEPWTLFDKELIERVAQDERIPPHLLRDLENPAHYLEQFGFHPRGRVTSDEAFTQIAAHLIQFARAGNAIIIGRGGAILCARLDNCFHFRLEAGLPWRVDSLARRLGLTPKLAAEQERANAHVRERFFREHLGADASDRSLYDAVFNNERHGVEAMAAAICGYVQEVWKRTGRAQERDHVIARVPD